MSGFDPKLAARQPRTTPISLQRQSTRYSCGIACVAMLAGVSEKTAIDKLSEVRGGQPIRGAKLRTRLLRDLLPLARALGLSAQAARYRGWDSISAAAIVGCDNGGRSHWHWVLAVTGYQDSWIIDPVFGECYRQSLWADHPEGYRGLVGRKYLAFPGLQVDQVLL